MPRHTDEAHKSRVEPFESSRGPTTPLLAKEDSSDGGHNRLLEQPCQVSARMFLASLCPTCVLGSGPGEGTLERR